MSWSKQSIPTISSEINYPDEATTSKSTLVTGESQPLELIATGLPSREHRERIYSRIRNAKAEIEARRADERLARDLYTIKMREALFKAFENERDRVELELLLDWAIKFDLVDVDKIVSIANCLRDIALTNGFRRLLYMPDIKVSEAYSCDMLYPFEQIRAEYFKIAAQVAIKPHDWFFAVAGLACFGNESLPDNISAVNDSFASFTNLYRQIEVSMKRFYNNDLNVGSKTMRSHYRQFCSQFFNILLTNKSLIKYIPPYLVVGIARATLCKTHYQFPCRCGANLKHAKLYDLLKREQMVPFNDDDCIVDDLRFCKGPRLNDYIECPGCTRNLLWTEEKCRTCGITTPPYISGQLQGDGDQQELTTDSGATSEIQSNTQFITQTDVSRPDASVGADLSMNDLVDRASISEGSWTASDIFERYLFLGTSVDFPTAAATSTVLATYSLPSAYYAENYSTNFAMLSTFLYFKSDFRFKISLKGTQFHLGYLGVWWNPMFARSPTFQSDYIPCMHIMNIPSQNHAYMNACESTEVELVVPWESIYGAVPTTGPEGASNANMFQFGQLVFQVVDPLQAGATATPKITFSVFVRAENAKVNIPFPMHTPLQGFFDTLVDMAGGALSAGVNFVTGNYVSGIANSVKALKSGYKIVSGNYDYPLRYQNHPSSTRGSALVHGVGMDNSTRLALSPLSQADPLPGYCDQPEVAMNLKTLCKIESMIYKITWNTAAGGSTNLDFFEMSPSHAVPVHSSGTGAATQYVILHSTLGYLTAPFALYRCTFVFRFKIISTPFHGGKIRVSHAYNPVLPAVFTSPTTRKMLPYVDFEMGANKTEFTYTVPWSSHLVWKNVPQFPRFFSQWGISANIPSDSESLGHLFVDVINPLIAPPNVANNVTILVFMSCDDIELQYPQYITPNIAPTFQGDVDPKDKDDDVVPRRMNVPVAKDVVSTKIGYSVFYTGESHMDIKDLIRRSNFIFKAVYTQVAGTPVEHNFSVPHTPVVDINTLYHFTSAPNIVFPNSLLSWASSMFVQWRGSLRYKMQVCAGTSSSGSSNVGVYITYAPNVWDTGAELYRPRINSASTVNSGEYDLAGTHYLIAGAANPMVEWEVPYVTNALSSLVTMQYTDTASTRPAIVSPGTMFITIPQDVPTSTAVVSTRLYIAAGDDFQLHRFVGPRSMAGPASSFNLPNLAGSTGLQGKGDEAPKGLIRGIKDAVRSVDSGMTQLDNFFQDQEVKKVPTSINSSAAALEQSTSKFNRVVDDIGEMTSTLTGFFKPVVQTEGLDWELPSHLVLLGVKATQFIIATNWYQRILVVVDTMVSYGVIMHIKLDLLRHVQGLLSEGNQVTSPSVLQGDGECPADFWSKAGAAIVSIASVATIGSLPKGSQTQRAVNKFGSQMKDVFSISQGVKGTIYLYEATMKLLKAMMEWFVGEECPEYIAEKLLSENADRFCKFINEVNEINREEIRLAAAFQIEERERICALREEADYLLKIIRDVPKKEGVALHNMFSRALTTITSSYDTIQKTNLLSTSRIDPYCLWLHGSPGVGKSQLATLIGGVLALELGSKHINSMYSRAVDEAYWSGYSHQRIVTIDDFGQDRACSTYNPYAEFIVLKSPVPKILPMASLEEKGRMFTSEALLITSNIPYPRPAVIEEAQAIWRRRNFMVEVSLKNQCLPPSEDNWEFRRMHPTHEGEYLGDYMSFIDFTTMLRRDTKRYIEVQRSLVNRTVADIEAIIARTQWEASGTGTLQGLIEPQIGDIVQFDRGLYKHYANYYGTTNGVQYVCHVTNNLDKSYFVVEPLESVAADTGTPISSQYRIVDLHLSAKARGLHRRSEKEFFDSLPAVGEVPYSVHENNCEHYATRHLYGVGWCSQTDAVVIPSVAMVAGVDLVTLGPCADALGTTPINLYTDITSALNWVKKSYYDATIMASQKIREHCLFFLSVLQKLLGKIDCSTPQAIEAVEDRLKLPWIQVTQYAHENHMTTHSVTARFNLLISELQKVRANKWRDHAKFCEEIVSNEELFSACLAYNDIFGYDFTEDVIMDADAEIKDHHFEKLKRVHKGLLQLCPKRTVLARKLEGCTMRAYKKIYLDNVKPFFERHPWLKATLSAVAMLLAGLGIYFGVKHLFGTKAGMAMQGKYSQENRINKMRIGKTIVARHAVLQGSDSNGEEICEHVIIPNLVNLKFYEPVTRRRFYEQRGLRIVDNYILLNKHALTLLDEGTICEVQWNGGAKAEMEIRAEDFIAHPEADYILLRFNKRLPAARNIIKQFITANDLQYIGRTPGQLVGSADGVSVTIMPTSVSPMDHAITVQDTDGTDVCYRSGWYYRGATRNGSCGSVLMIMNPRLPRKIAGIHGINFPNTPDCFAVLVVQEHLQQMVNCFSKDPVVDGLPIESIAYSGESPLQGNFTSVEKLTTYPRQPGKSKIRKSPIQDLIKEQYPLEYLPAVLRPGDPRTILVGDPIVPAVSKYGRELGLFDRTLLGRAITSVKDELVYKIKPLRTPAILTVSEAINGLPQYDHYEPIDMKTSPGWPYILTRPPNESGKRWLFEGEVGQLVPKDEQLKARLNERWSCWIQGRRPESCNIDCRKDELRDLARVLAGKTRAFSMANVDMTINGRRLCEDFVSAFYAAHNTFFSAVGMDCESSEWTKMYNYLTEVSHMGFAGDYSNYDGSAPPEIIDAIIDMISDWYDHYGGIDKTTRLMRKVMSDEIIHTVSIMNDHKYQKHQGNPSGVFLTVVLNTILGEIYLRYAYLTIMREARVSENSDIDTTLEGYKKGIRTQVYGDDNIVMVHKIYQPYFNMPNVHTAMARLGIEYTRADKKTFDIGKDEPLESIWNLTLLKRGFGTHPTISSWIVPLMDKKTVRRLTQWVSSGNDDVTLMYDNLRDSLRFAAFHGREYYHNHLRIVNSTLDRANFEPVLLNWEDFMERFQQTFTQTKLIRR